MPQLSILIADDIENQTIPGKRRSKAVRDAASSLAARLSADIAFLYVEDMKSYPPPHFDASRLQAWHARHQDTLQEAAGQFTVPVREIMQTGAPAEQILRVLALRKPPELAVMGTQGRKGLKRLVVGSVAEEVIRHARRPVMVIGPAAQERDQSISARKKLRILVATDLGKSSRAAEHYALSLAKRTGAQAVLFHCLADSYRIIIQSSSTITGWVPVDLEEILRGIRDDVITALRQKVQFYRNRGISCDYQIQEEIERSSCAIYEESAKGYDLVVMGTHGRNIIMEGFFGSTARETILHSPVPVITVHPGK